MCDRQPGVLKFPRSVDLSESEAQTCQSLKFGNQAISSFVSGNLALAISVIKGTVPKLSTLSRATVCLLSTGQPQSRLLWVLARKIPPRLAKSWQKWIIDPDSVKGTQIWPIIGAKEKSCMMKCHRHNLSRSCCISFPEKLWSLRLVETWVWSADNRHPIVHWNQTSIYCSLSISIVYMTLMSSLLVKGLQNTIHSLWGVDAEKQRVSSSGIKL